MGAPEVDVASRPKARRKAQQRVVTFVAPVTGTLHVEAVDYLPVMTLSLTP
jgi:hypothetical protein